MPADGFVEELGGIIEFELFFEARGISLDGFETDAQMIGDLPCAKTASEQLKYFQLAVAQLFDGGSGRRWPRR